jgi:predicted GNAT family acetyltransferase
MFTVRRLEASEFCATVVPELAAREVENDVMVGLALRIAAVPTSAPNSVFCAVEAAGKLVGAALRTPPQLVIVTELPAGAARAVAEFFRSIADVPDGASGPHHHGRDVAACFASFRGGRLEHASDEILYTLPERGALRERPAPPGAARLATDADAGVLTRFFAEFFREIALPHAPDPVEYAARAIARGSAWLWDDGGPRAIACCARHMTTGSAIGPVYTAAEARRRGYGSAVTAALCRDLFAGGRKFVCLHADRNNPQSNDVYRALGFEEVGAFNVWTVA